MNPVLDKMVTFPGINPKTLLKFPPYDFRNINLTAFGLRGSNTTNATVGIMPELSKPLRDPKSLAKILTSFAGKDSRSGATNWEDVPGLLNTGLFGNLPVLPSSWPRLQSNNNP